VFERFQLDTSLAGIFINHAHNEYLEWVFEGGLMIILLLVFFIFLYLFQWWSIWKDQSKRSFQLIKVSSGLGILMMMAHSFVDYNLHIPANQIYFSILLGIFFSQNAISENKL